MSEPIKVGDLVYVKRTHCPSGSEGMVRVVVGLRLPHTAQCPACGRVMTACAAELDEGYGWNPVQWLKRIPPLSELEGEKRDEELAV